MTTSKEDYLVAIYRLSEKETPVTNKKLTVALGVSAPSVSEMLGTLSNEEYILYEPYKGSSLTEKGKKKLFLFFVAIGCGRCF